jgi:hypothetical protein
MRRRPPPTRANQLLANRSRNWSRAVSAAAAEADCPVAAVIAAVA